MFTLFSVMDSPIRVVPTPNQFFAFQEKYTFQLENGETFHGEHACFINPQEGKIGIYVNHFDVEYCLPSSDFFREVLGTRKVNIN